MKNVYQYFKDNVANGQLHFQYLTKILAHFGFDFNRRLLNDFFQILDVDKSSTLDWEEFIMAIKNPKAIKIYAQMVTEIKNRR